MSIDNPVVMVIEDEALLLQAISDKLKLNKLETISCSSAEQAIDYLKNLSQLPDLIWLDYHLKKMDGLAFMGLLKGNELWSKIPVIVVSNSASTEKVQQMLALGAKKYILKAEHRLEDIINSLREILQEIKN